MPYMRNRHDGALHVKSLHAMLGHEGGTNTALPVERLDHALKKSGNGKSKGKGLRVGDGVGDIKTSVNIPSASAMQKKVAKQMKADPNAPRKKKK